MCEHQQSVTLAGQNYFKTMHVTEFQSQLTTTNLFIVWQGWYCLKHCRRYVQIIKKTQSSYIIDLKLKSAYP